MKWFDKWFLKKCKQAWEESSKESAPSPGELKPIRSNSIDTNGMNFTVYRANGGHVIETRTHDRRNDRYSHGLHIITDDKNLGEEIAKIITFENIRS